MKSFILRIKPVVMLAMALLIVFTFKGVVVAQVNRHAAIADPYLGKLVANANRDFDEVGSYTNAIGQELSAKEKENIQKEILARIANYQAMDKHVSEAKEIAKRDKEAREAREFMIEYWNSINQAAADYIKLGPDDQDNYRNSLTDVQQADLDDAVSKLNQAAAATPPSTASPTNISTTGINVANAVAGSSTGSQSSGSTDIVDYGDTSGSSGSCDQPCD